MLFDLLSCIKLCVLYACKIFSLMSAAEMPYIKVPLHTIIKLTPIAYGCNLEEIIVPIAAVDDHKMI